MKILTLHSDHLTVEPKKKALKDAEKWDKKILKAKNCLVVFTSVEKSDEENIKDVFKRYVKEVQDVCKQVNTKTVVLYPYVHLTSKPSSPKVAQQFLLDAEKLAIRNLLLSYRGMGVLFFFYKKKTAPPYPSASVQAATQ